MSAAERVYRLLLLAFPSAFRAEYGREMTLLFRDRRRTRAESCVRFWTDILMDVARSAPNLRAAEGRARRTLHLEGWIMRTMAILAILVGTLEVVGSAAEAAVGGFALHGGYSLAVGSVAAAASALLIASAIAMLRGAKGAVPLAQGSAIACLAIFASVAALRPIFSVLGSILGIGFPVVLLVYLRVAQNREPAAATL